MADKLDWMSLVPASMSELVARVNGPDDIDGATAQLGMHARLMNPHLATPADLTAVGLGKCTHIPVQIAKRDGGRKSLYFLDPGEEVLAGIFVGSAGVAFRYVSRISGEGTPAKTGDEYRTRIQTSEGRVVLDVSGKLELIDPKKGVGQIAMKSESAGISSLWIVWSCIYIEN